MNTKLLVTLLMLILLLVGCNNNKQLNKDNKHVDEITKDETSEDFFEFIDKFASNNDFQLSRIKFPASYKMEEITEDDKSDNIIYDEFEEKYYKINPIEKDDWKFIEKKYLTEAVYEEDAYEAKWVKQSEYIMDMIMGWIDSESDYHIRFQKMDEKWFLTNYWDAYDYQYADF